MEKNTYTELKHQLPITVIGHPVEECDGTKHIATDDIHNIWGLDITYCIKLRPPLVHRHHLLLWQMVVLLGFIKPLE